MSGAAATHLQSISRVGMGTSAATSHAAFASRCCASLSIGSLEEREVAALDRHHEEGAVEVLVAPFARCLGEERACVARRAMQRAVERGHVFGAEGVGGAQRHAFEGMVE